MPFLLDRTAVKKTLDEMGGDVNKAVNKLLDAEDGGFTSSAQESSSVEREPDSDDDAVYGPNKRQDRRMSKATRALMKDKAEYRREAFAKIEQNDGSQESIASSNGSQGWEDLPELEPPQPRRRKDEDEDSDWRPEVEPLTDDDRGSAPPPTADQKIRIKMNFSTLPPPSSGPQKSHLRQQGPQSRRLPARQRKELKKQAQKTARKKRAQADAQANGLIPQQKTELPMHFKNAVEGLKTIHI